MAVAFVTVRSAAASTTANLAISTSFTATGTDIALVFAIGIHSTTVSVTAVTWSAGGTPGRISRQASTSGACGELWGLTVPTHGSGSATAHLSASNLCTGDLLLYSACDQTNAFSSGDTAFSTSTVASVTLIPTNIGANDVSVGYANNVTNGNWSSFTTNQRVVNNAVDPGYILGDSAGTTKDTIVSDGGPLAGQCQRTSIRIRATVGGAAAIGWGRLIAGDRNNRIIGND